MNAALKKPAPKSARAERRRGELTRTLGRHRVDLVDLPVGGSVVDPLVAYLHMRERRRR